MIKEIKTDKAPVSAGPYPQAVVQGKLVYCSGQLGIYPGSGGFAEDDAAVQAEQALHNLEVILEVAGSSIDKVIRVEIFLSDINDLSMVDKVYEKHFTYEVKPARQAVEVSRLTNNAKVEISCIAYIP